MVIRLDYNERHFIKKNYKKKINSTLYRPKLKFRKNKQIKNIYYIIIISTYVL